MTTVLPPLGLYVHLPWCIRKCPYCDFNSYEKRDALPEREYVAALLRDLDADLPLVGSRTLTSIFIGGGTPSLFSGGAIAALLHGIRARISTASDIEITLEANPGAAEASRFAEFRVVFHFHNDGFFRVQPLGAGDGRAYAAAGGYVIFLD